MWLLQPNSKYCIFWGCCFVKGRWFLSVSKLQSLFMTLYCVVSRRQFVQPTLRWKSRLYSSHYYRVLLGDTQQNAFGGGVSRHSHLREQYISAISRHTITGLIVQFNNNQILKMSLTAKDKSLVKSFFGKITPKAEDIGNEALSRYRPQFSHISL